MIKSHGNKQTIGYKERKRFEDLGPGKYVQQLLSNTDIYGKVSVEDKKELESITAALSCIDEKLSGLEKETKIRQNLQNHCDIIKEHLYITGTRYRTDKFVKDVKKQYK